MTKLIKYYFLVFQIWFSGRNHKTSDIWDKTLNNLMLNGTVVKLTFFRIYFLLNDEEYQVWIENKWYAYGYNCLNKGSKTSLPSIKTAIKLSLYIETYNLTCNSFLVN
jgi:hypothetical protein